MDTYYSISSAVRYTVKQILYSNTDLLQITLSGTTRIKTALNSSIVRDFNVSTTKRDLDITNGICDSIPALCRYPRNAPGARGDIIRLKEHDQANLHDMLSQESPLALQSLV